MRALAFLPIGIAAFAFAGCQSPATPLDPHDLQTAAQQIASFAGESEWLAQQLRVHSVTANMAWVHERALGEDAAKVARELATKPAPAPLQATHQRLTQLDARLQTVVTRIAAAADHADELDALQREAHAIAAQARTMGSPS